jgi:HAE1 family hydrophobic/amphiphilic exporter-1
MFVIAVVLFGWVSLGRLALNLLPDISYPSLTVQTDYPDAAPEEVENLITRPIEEAVGVVPGLVRLSSVSRAGQSEVILEFTWKSKMDLSSLEVREKLDFITLPRDSRRPVLLRFDPSHDPVMRLQLSGNMGLARLRYAAERELKKYLESTDGVAAIKVIGGLEEQIRIEIDEKRLSRLGIPITEVTQVLAQENLNQASGSLYDQESSYLVRILNQFKSVEEIQQIIIRDTAGRRVILGDIARVWRGAKDREVIARLNGQESVELAIYKEGDANTVTVARAVERRLDSLKRQNLFPAGVNYQVVFNQADFIQASVDDVLDSAIIGGALAIIVLFIFLRDLRSTLLIGITIPVSIMATFALMYQTGISLNLMSLGGVALGVGNLVDNSIVVLEAVHRYRKPGVPVFQAVFRGTKEVAMAVTASTFTTVAAFVPLIFIEGIAGQLFKDQALTITYSQIVSLLVGLTVIPMVLALQMRKRVQERGAAAFQTGQGWRARLRATGHFLFHELAATIVADLRRGARAIGSLGNRIVGPLFDPITASYDRLSSAYPRFLRFSLDHKPVVLLTAVGVAGIAVFLAFRIGAELIPPMSQGEFLFEIRLPDGKPLEHTDRLLQDLAFQTSAFEGVKVAFTSAGGSNQNQFARDLREENVGQLYVVMSDKKDQLLEARTIDKIRDLLRRHNDVSFKFSRPTLFSFKTPVEVEIYGQDLQQLSKTADLVADRMTRVRGLSDITSSTRLGNPEVQVRFDRERLARLGLEEAQVAQVLRNKIRGDVASRYREHDKQIEILVRASENDRSTIDDIRNLTINLTNLNRAPAVFNPTTERREPGNPAAGMQNQNQPGGAAAASAPQAQPSPAAATAPVPIRLGSVADVQVARGPSEVRRIRTQRAAVVSANLSGRDLNSAYDDIRAILADLRDEVPPDTTLALGGQNEELSASYRSLLLALALAVFLVYLVMASEFESLLHPFLILFSVPLGLAGVVFALFVTGTTFSVMVFLGVIILSGIVVNNAIVLIDYTRQLREEGRTAREALIEAGMVRLRPILMTTLTTVLGLVPMAIGWGEGAEIRAPMAITVIGGLTVSTLLTLVFIPVLYEWVEGAPAPEPAGAAAVRRDREGAMGPAVTGD